MIDKTKLVRKYPTGIGLRQLPLHQTLRWTMTATYQRYHYVVSALAQRFYRLNHHPLVLVQLGIRDIQRTYRSLSVARPIMNLSGKPEFLANSMRYVSDSRKRSRRPLYYLGCMVRKKNNAVGESESSVLYYQYGQQSQ